MNTAITSMQPVRPRGSNADVQSHQFVTHSLELSRLLSAAVVSRRFCGLLLADPIAALASGYNGEQFRLTPEERQRILAIRASSLAEFARQLEIDQRQPLADPGHGVTPLGAYHNGAALDRAGVLPASTPSNRASPSALVDEVTACVTKALGELASVRHSVSTNQDHHLATVVEQAEVTLLRAQEPLSRLMAVLTV